MKKDLRELYTGVPIPPELGGAVERGLEAGARRRAARRPGRAFVRAAAPLAAACAVFVLLLNTVPTFAAAMYDLPVIGGICRVLTIADYHESSHASEVDVRLPAIDSGDASAPWADEVNELIRTTVEAEVAESERRAEEYYDAYVSTGGDPEEFIPVRVDAGYEVYHTGDRLLSFAVIKTESGAAVYSSFHYYNYDVTTGEELTLEDLIGENYLELCVSAVENGLAALDDESKSMLWEDTDLESAINESSAFYINEAGNVVLVFDKYALGAGALGRLEFEVAAAA